MDYKHRARNYESKLLKNFFGNVDKTELKKTESKMMLSVLIMEGITKKELTKKEFAAEMKVMPSVVTRWLSGTHNFTVETLVDIELLLNVKLLNV